MCVSSPVPSAELIKLFTPEVSAIVDSADHFRGRSHNFDAFPSGPAPGDEFLDSLTAVRVMIAGDFAIEKTIVCRLLSL